MSDKKTPKKRGRGRPPLPKGHVKAVVPIRFKDQDVEQYSRAAKARKQSLSEWIRDGLKVWDDRLDENGIDAIMWPGAGNAPNKTLELVFKERTGELRKSDDRLGVKQELFADGDQNHYSATDAHPELKKRGIEKVWVTTTQKPTRSAIHIQIVGLSEPITIIKRY